MRYTAPLIIFILILPCIAIALKGNNSFAEDLFQRAKERITARAVTKECRDLIVSEYTRQLIAFSTEAPLPFEDKEFENECWSVQGEEKGDRITFSPATLRIAYLILAHEHPDQVIRLIKALNEPGHIFIVHVDLKRAEMYNHLEKWSNPSNTPGEIASRVYLVPRAQSKRVTWGGWSVVDATLACMKQALSSAHTYDFMLLLSGSSYPLQANRQIRAALAAASEKGDIINDIASKPDYRPPDRWYSYIDCDDKLHRVGRLSAPVGLALYSGSQWWAISRAVASWLLSANKTSLPELFSAYARRTMVPDETYFATLFTHSPYCDGIVRPYQGHAGPRLMHVEWGESGGWVDPEGDEGTKCLLPSHARSRCGRSPKVVTFADRHTVLASNALFARKFDATVEQSQLLLDAIDQRRAFYDEMGRWTDERLTRTCDLDEI